MLSLAVFLPSGLWKHAAQLLYVGERGTESGSMYLVQLVAGYAGAVKLPDYYPMAGIRTTVRQEPNYRYAPVSC